MSLQTLPTYQEVITGNPLGGNHLPTLILEGRQIVASRKPECAIYELNSSPCEAAAYTYIIYKVGPHSTTSSGQPRINHQRHPIYEFTAKRSFSLRDVSDSVTIEGKSRRSKTYKDVTLTGGLAGWTSCAAAGHFAGRIPTRDRLRNHGKIVWKNDDGLIVALETRPKIRQDGTLDGESQLNLHEALPVPETDLLVACWMARLWMESKAQLHTSQPRASGKCLFFPLKETLFGAPRWLY